MRHFLLALAALLPTAALAAPVHYDEAVGGDLSNGPGVGTVFVLTAGTHTIKGTFGIGGDDPNDFDAFVFVFFSSFQLLSLSVEVDDATGNVTATDWRLRTGSLISGGTSLDLLDVTTVPGMASAEVPIAPGTYHLAHTRIAANGGAQIRHEANYTFTIEMAPAAAVPVASTLPLAALALPVLLVGQPQRRRRS